MPGVCGVEEATGLGCRAGRRGRRRGWNKIEHRLFSFITQNWRGKPLVTHQVIVNLIAATTTKKGLSVRCELDTNVYPTGRKVTDAEVAAVNIRRDTFHGEWNYTILPLRMRSARTGEEPDGHHVSS